MGIQFFGGLKIVPNALGPTPTPIPNCDITYNIVTVPNCDITYEIVEIPNCDITYLVVPSCDLTYDIITI